MACTCVKEECGKGSGTVKGYITTVECDECKARREAEALVSNARRVEENLRIEKEALIQAKLKEWAEGQLKTEGKLTESGEIVK